MARSVAVSVAILAILGAHAAAAAQRYQNHIQDVGLGGVDQRPAYHVMPADDWCNDPNGPMYFNGVYHLFFQYNPSAAVWGNMHWGHAVSQDLAHWQLLPPALAPDMPYDRNGVFSGSATIVAGKPILTYTCVGDEQLQCIAVPANLSDPLLVDWVKPVANPVIAKQPYGTVGGNFRDPTTAWWSNQYQYVMGVGVSLQPDASTPAVGGVQLYSTSDFMKWEPLTVLWNNSAIGPMWECPDVFPVGNDLYAIKASVGGRDWYTIGSLSADGLGFTPTTPTRLYDYGQWYASKSFNDSSHDRRILWGWVAEEDSQGPARGWASLQSLPRVMTFDADLQQLNYEPAVELQALREDILLSKADITVTPGNIVFPAVASDQCEIVAVLEIPTPPASPATLPVVDNSFGLLVRTTPDSSIYTKVAVRQLPLVHPTNNTDMPGGDYLDFNFAAGPEAQQVTACQTACTGDAQCVGWTYVRPMNGAPARCSMKSLLPGPNPNTCCVSGIPQRTMVYVDRARSSTDGNSAAQGGGFAMKSTDTQIDLRVFLDHSMVEVYAQQGRARIASRIYPNSTAATGIGLFSTMQPINVISMQVYSMGNAFNN